MVGYSDSAKDGGYLAAQWAIHDALSGLAWVARRARRRARRSSTAAAARPVAAAARRYQAILAQPPGHPPGRLRITEQGETIAFKYGLPGLARHNLEQALAATLLSAFPEVVAPRRAAGRRRADGGGRGRAREAFADLVHRRPRVPGLLPRLHADRRAGAAGDRLAPRTAARRGRRGRGAAGDPVGLRVDAEPLPAARLVRRRHRARRRRRPARPACASCAACTATGPSSARSSTTSR